MRLEHAPNKSVQVGTKFKSNLPLKRQINSTQYKKEITHTKKKKVTYNVHDPEFEVEVEDKSTSGK